MSAVLSLYTHRRFALAVALALSAPVAFAQHHGGRSSPPTAPVAPPPPPPPPPVAASSGLGAIQFVQVDYGVPAPQALTRQLRFEDERIRAGALSAIGAPGQYLQHGHIPMPRSVSLEFEPLGATDELDALVTVELDQHIVTAVLVPGDGSWRRIATLSFATPFLDPSTTPSRWLRTMRSLAQPDRYRAVFHASGGTVHGNFAENEAHLRIFNNRAVITISFESMAHDCVGLNQPTPPGTHPAPRNGCNVTTRWFQSDPVDAARRFQLITATGHLSAKDAAQPYATSPIVLNSHLRKMYCQPFTYSETSQHFEPAAPPGPCPTK